MTPKDHLDEEVEKEFGIDFQELLVHIDRRRTVEQNQKLGVEQRRGKKEHTNRIIRLTMLGLLLLMLRVSLLR